MAKWTIINNTIASGTVHDYTEMMQVPGGALVRTIIFDGTNRTLSVCFVAAPDRRQEWSHNAWKDLINKVEE